MAGSLLDIEVLMDHNMKLSSSVAPPKPSHSSFSSSLAEADSEPDGVQGHQIVSVPSHRQHAVSHPPLVASLSLAFKPVLSLNPILSKPRFFPSKALASAAVKLPSQRKCISPTPFMPAISAVTTGLGVAMPGAGTVSVGAKKFSSAFPDYLRLPDKNNSFGNPYNAAGMRRASIVWFRNDLRCHDNEALFTASKESLSVLPVYIFDSCEFGRSSAAFSKTAPHRARFLLQCVSDLREKLKELGSDLVVRVGKPEEVLLSLAKAIGADALYAHQEVSYEGMQIEKRVHAILQDEGIDVKYFWGNTLFHLDDLPFKLKDLPATYSAFHEKVSHVGVRDTIETPKQLKGFPIRGGVKPGDMPSVEDLGSKKVSSLQKDASNVTAPLIGGEKEAVQRLERLVAEHVKLSSNRAAGNDNLYAPNISSKISPWLALGCLSPRRAFEEFKNKGKSVLASTGSNASEKGPNWLLYELLWRDFFRFVTRKHAASRLSSDATSKISAPVAAGCV